MKFIDLVLYVVYAGTYSIVLPVFIGAFVLKKMDRSISVFYYGLIVVLVLDFVILFVNARLRNAFLYLFTIIDILVMAFVFTHGLHNPRGKSIIRIASGLMVAVVVIDGLLISGLAVNGLSNAVARILIAAMGIYYLSQMMMYDIEKELTKDPMLWICLGAIVFNLVGFLDVFATSIMSYSQNLYLQYYMLWAVCTLSMYLLYAQAFRKIGTNE